MVLFLFVFFKVLEGSSLSCKVKLVVQPFCTTRLLVSYNAVSISCECYKAKAGQTVGARGPMTLHACKQNSVLTPFTVSPKRKSNFHGLSIYLEVARSQKVLSGDFLPLLVHDWLLMRPLGLAKGDVSLGKRRKEGSGGGLMLTAVWLPNKLTRAGRGSGGAVQAVQRVMSLLLN